MGASQWARGASWPRWAVASSRAMSNGERRGDGTAEDVAEGAHTAEEVAERVGLSPSAVSHHLRQLEKFGLAVRAPAARDGRERPWRAASGALNLLPGGADPIGRRAVEQIIGRQLELLIRRIENAEAFSTTGPVTGLGRTDLWLTPQELSELQHGLRALLDRTSGRSSRRHPEGAAYHVFLYSLLRDHSGVSAPEAGEP